MMKELSYAVQQRTKHHNIALGDALSVHSSILTDDEMST